MKTVEELAKELERIGDDNADWGAVALHIQLLCLEARLEELKRMRSWAERNLRMETLEDQLTELRKESNG